MNQQVKTDVFPTPDWLFDALNKRYSFSLDPCALPENAKCKKYFTPEDDGLKQDWSNHIVFMNPPYNRYELPKWVAKAAENRAGITVALLPAKTDTKWFHDIVLKTASYIYFIKGRLKFGGNYHASFGSMVVVWVNHMIQVQKANHVPELRVTNIHKEKRNELL